MPNTTPTHGFVRPSFLGDFVKFNNCHRYYKLTQAEDEQDLVHHATSDYVESFRGPNVVEKHAGNTFETNLLETFIVHATDVLDLSSLSLDTVASLSPTAVQRTYELHDTETDQIRRGDFRIDDDDPADITLGQSDDGHIQLRATYTADLIEYIINGAQHAPLQLDTQQLPTNIATQPDKNNAPLRTSTNPIILYQPTFYGQIGAWNTGGDGDFVFIWYSNDDIHIRVLDAKLATDEKPHHQVQAAIYADLLTDTIDASAYTSITAGIITPDPDTHTPLSRDTIPSFDLTDRYTDVTQLLQANGDLDKAREGTFDTAPYQLDQKCSGCQFNEACYVDTIESETLETLGIGQSDQQALTNNNIDSLHDLAKTIDPVRTTGNHFDTITPRDNLLRSAGSTYFSLVSSPGLGERITDLIQDAQSLLGEFYPAEQHTYAYDDMHLYTNAPPSSLPRVEFSDDLSEQGFIRVYVNVQNDHVQDTIHGISALITHFPSGTEHHVTKVQDTVTLDRDTAQSDEKTMLSEFATDLLDTLKMTSDMIDLSNEPQQYPIIHFYTYTERERERLQHALVRHTTPYTASATQSYTTQQTLSDTEQRQSHDDTGTTTAPPLAVLRDLLGHTEGPDQLMVSPIQPEINTRMAKKTPTTGLLNVWQFFTPPRKQARVNYASFGEYTPSDPTRLPPGQSTLDVTDGLSYKLFNNTIEYTVGPGGITLYPRGTSDNDGWFPMRVRTAAQIPLGYLWAGAGAIDDDWITTLDREQDKEIAKIYQYYDRSTQHVTIVNEDIKHTMRVMTKLLRHVEQGIPNKETATNTLTDNQ